MNLLTRCLASLIGVVLTIQCIGDFNNVYVWRSVAAIALAGMLVVANGLASPRAIIARINTLGVRGRRILATAIFALSITYFCLSALLCGRAFHPSWHDDQMHAVQAQMLATGHLWLPPHPMHQFFDTFHIFMTPVYAPIHFPGTAIINVSAVWLGLPYGVIPILLISAACALAYLLLSEVVSGIAGVLAVAFLWASPDARMLATMATSHNAMIFLGVLVLWLFVQWQKHPTLLWSIALGTLIGLSAITRPVDALAFAIPIGIAVLIETIRRRKGWLNIPVMIVCMLPFLSLQLVFDHGVTGEWLTPPYERYNDLFHPYSSYGSARLEDLSKKPVHVSDLVQKQIYYEVFVLPFVRNYVQKGPFGILWQERLAQTFGNELPFALLIFFLPLGVLALNTTTKWVVAIPPILYLTLYIPHVFYLTHYPPIVLVSMTALVCYGVSYFSHNVLSRWALAEPFIITSAMAAAIIGMTPLSFIGGTEFSTVPFKAVTFVYEQLPKKVQQPALVFCRMNPNLDSVHDEPVYNTSTAWPDDAKIVLAQSLGPKNLDLIRYYASIGQNRHVYEFNRQFLTVSDFGTVNQILANASRGAVGPSSRPSN